MVEVREETTRRTWIITKNLQGKNMMKFSYEDGKRYMVVESWNGRKGKYDETGELYLCEKDAFVDWLRSIAEEEKS